jgi:predicted patatin/cPLA2 family phospholipase
VLLSGGGQWGAFGAGFLKGWSENGGGETARPDLPDAVTGVSTGAVQATAVYLGRAYDNLLVSEYNIASQSELVKDRGSLFFLMAGSRGDQRRLYRKLVHELDPLIDKVTAESEIHPSRSLAVGVVDAQSGRSQAIDLIAITQAFKAPGQRQIRDQCYAGAILASSAIPADFTQVRDRLPVNGLPSVYLDGGVRHAAILGKILKMWSSQPEKGRAFLILNAETTLAPAPPSDLRPDVLGALDLTLRSVIDQIEMETIFDTAAGLPGARTWYVTADGADCQSVQGSERFFSPPFMRCLAKYGEATWSSGSNPWIAIDADRGKQ